VVEPLVLIFFAKHPMFQKFAICVNLINFSIFWKKNIYLKNVREEENNYVSDVGDIIIVFALKTNS
jgi:hypothetical protein